MKAIALVIPTILAFLAACLPADAQNVNLNCFTGVAPWWAPCTAANPLAVSASVTASVSGFQPSASGARGTPVSVTTSDSSGTLPTGTVVAVTNVGSNPMYCNVNNVAATTSDQLITSGGGWFAFTIPTGVTVLHCIATGSTTTANMVGGAGLATGIGGGSSGGGSSITSWGGGTLGAMANYGTSPGAVLVPGVNAFVTNTVSDNLAQVNGTTILVNAGAVGTGSPRVAVAQDTTTIAGSAPGTAGSASANVVTVQGVASMTPVQVSQATASNLNATVVGTGTFAVQSTGAASQATIGNVGGLNKRVCYNPTVTNGTYAVNVVMGGLFTAANLFTSTGSGVIQSVELNFTTAQTVAFKLYYFEANPNNSTWTDHSAAAINATDSLVVGGYVSLANPDSGLGSNDTVYSAIGLGITYTPGGTSGYFVLVPTATTASLGATSNAFNLCVSVLQNS
jgi:hypothetical protein